MFQMHRDNESFGPKLATREAAEAWFWSPAGKEAFLALPDIDNPPSCMFAQSVFGARAVPA